MNPKKYDLVPDQMGEMMSNSDKSEEEEIPSYPIAYNNNDPFYQYKPKHPADVNLLAPSSVRFVILRIFIAMNLITFDILDSQNLHFVHYAQDE